MFTQTINRERFCKNRGTRCEPIENKLKPTESKRYVETERRYYRAGACCVCKRGIISGEQQKKKKKQLSLESSYSHILQDSAVSVSILYKIWLVYPVLGRVDETNTGVRVSCKKIIRMHRVGRHIFTSLYLDLRHCCYM